MSSDQASDPAVATPSVAVVDTQEQLQDMLLHLASCSLLAVDCEGVDLSRVGELCLLILAVPDGRSWLVDVCALGRAALALPCGPEGLSVKAVLECDQVVKLCYDVRRDSDALYHQCGVQLAAVYDLQVAEVAVRRYVQRRKVGLVMGLQKSLETYLTPEAQQQLAASGIDKKAVHRMFDDDDQFWVRRPLSELMVQYAINDVLYLFALYTRFESELPPKVMLKVKAISLERVKEYALEPMPESGKHRAVAPDF